MSSRAALRALSNTGSFIDLARESRALVSLRAILVGVSRGFERSADAEELERAARAAYSDGMSAARAISGVRSANFAVESAYSTADAAHSSDSAAEALVASVDSASFLRVSAKEATLTAALFDADHESDALRSIGVWAGTSVPEAIAENHLDFLTYLQSHEDWKFWHRWYSQMWEVTFIDWDLAIEVAKIPDEVWDEGLGAVAEAIRGIEARLALKDAVSEFRKTVEVVADEGIRVHRGHNNPPELIDKPQLVAEREIVWAAIDDLEREIEENDPDKDVVRRSIDVIAHWVREVLMYLGRKGDLTIDQVIKWGVPLGGTYLLANPAKLQQIIAAGTEWLRFLQ